MQVDEKYFERSQSGDTIDSVLEDGEKVLFRSKPNKRSYVMAAALKMLPIAIIWLCFDAAFLTLIGIEISKGNMPKAMLGVLVPFFLVHLAPVWIWISRIVKSTIEIKNIEYAFTDKRVIVRSGVIGIDFKFFYYEKIESVVAKVGLIDRVCKVGDIYITAAGTAGVIFDQTDPYSLASKLQKLASDFRADLYYPNELRPASDDSDKQEKLPADNENATTDESLAAADPLADKPAWENASPKDDSGA